MKNYDARRCVNSRMNYIYFVIVEHENVFKMKKNKKIKQTMNNVAKDNRPRVFGVAYRLKLIIN